MTARLTARPIALAAFLSALTIAPANAQETIPDPGIQLPSVSDYSLPPGETADPPADQTQGPADEIVPSPQPAPQTQPEAATSNPPVQTQPAQSQPRPAASAPQQTAPPTRSTPTTTRSPATARPVPAPRQVTAEPVTQPPNLPVLQSETPPEATSRPSTADFSAIPTPDTEDVPAYTTPASDQGEIPVIPIGIALAVMFVIGTAVFLLRRKKASVPAEKTGVAAEKVGPEPETKESAKQPQKEQRQSAPKIYSPPVPKPEPEPAPANNGFITTKKGLAPKPESVPAKTPVTNPPTPESRDIEIVFVAEKASSTLMNAVVGYQLSVTNKGKEEIRDLKITGAMIQADQNSQDLPSSHDTILHEHENLEAGGSVDLSGELRLPLNMIKPISYKDQSLFIPLALFRFDYADKDKSACWQTASFIVGQEHQPPRPKMAPFRLDLGPRIFSPVGQRPLTYG